MGRLGRDPVHMQVVGYCLMDAILDRLVKGILREIGINSLAHSLKDSLKEWQD